MRASPPSRGQRVAAWEVVTRLAPASTVGDRQPQPVWSERVTLCAPIRPPEIGCCSDTFSVWIGDLELWNFGPQPNNGRPYTSDVLTIHWHEGKSPNIDANAPAAAAAANDPAAAAAAAAATVENDGKNVQPRLPGASSIEFDKPRNVVAAPPPAPTSPFETAPDSSTVPSAAAARVEAPNLASGIATRVSPTVRFQIMIDAQSRSEPRCAILKLLPSGDRSCTEVRCIGNPIRRRLQALAQKDASRRCVRCFRASSYSAVWPSNSQKPHAPAQRESGRGDGEHAEGHSISMSAQQITESKSRHHADVSGTLESVKIERTSQGSYQRLRTQDASKRMDQPEEEEEADEEADPSQTQLHDYKQAIDDASQQRESCTLRLLSLWILGCVLAVTMAVAGYHWPFEFSSVTWAVFALPFIIMGLFVLVYAVFQILSCDTTEFGDGLFCHIRCAAGRVLLLLMQRWCNCRRRTQLHEAEDMVRDDYCERHGAAMHVEYLWEPVLVLKRRLIFVFFGVFFFIGMLAVASWASAKDDAAFPIYDMSHALGATGSKGFEDLKTSRGAFGISNSDWASHNGFRLQKRMVLAPRSLWLRDTYVSDVDMDYVRYSYRMAPLIDVLDGNLTRQIDLMSSECGTRDEESASGRSAVRESHFDACIETLGIPKSLRVWVAVVRTVVGTQHISSTEQWRSWIGGDDTFAQWDAHYSYGEWNSSRETATALDMRERDFLMVYDRWGMALPHSPRILYQRVLNDSVFRQRGWTAPAQWSSASHDAAGTPFLILESFQKDRWSHWARTSLRLAIVGAVFMLALALVTIYSLHNAEVERSALTKRLSHELALFARL